MKLAYDMKEKQEQKTRLRHEMKTVNNKAIRMKQERAKLKQEDIKDYHDAEEARKRQAVAKIFSKH